MKKKSQNIKREKSILPAAIIAGLLVAIIIYAAMLNAEKNALMDFEKGTIYVAVKQVPEGTLITEENYESYFTIKELDKKLIPKTAVNSREQLLGLVPGCTIDTGTMITLGMFESINDIIADMDEPVIAGFKAEDIFQVVDGVLRAGDRIHIYTVSESGQAILQWENVYIEGVFDQTGAAIDNSNHTTAAQRINVYLDKTDIEEFYTNLANGSLRVVKVL